MNTLIKMRLYIDIITHYMKGKGITSYQVIDFKDGDVVSMEIEERKDENKEVYQVQVTIDNNDVTILNEKKEDLVALLAKNISKSEFNIFKNECYNTLKELNS